MYRLLNFAVSSFWCFPKCSSPASYFHLERNGNRSQGARSCRRKIVVTSTATGTSREAPATVTVVFGSAIYPWRLHRARSVLGICHQRIQAVRLEVGVPVP